MAIDITNGWTAASLTPGFQSGSAGLNDPSLGTRSIVPATPTVNPASTLVSPVVGNILSAIYGPGYQSLLNTNGTLGQNPGYVPPTPQQVAANAYATEIGAKTGAMSQFSQYQQQLKRMQSDSTPAGIGGLSSDQLQRQNQLLGFQALAPDITKISQAAALSPNFAPVIFPTPNTTQATANWNPYGLSGWISPLQSGAGAMRGPNIAQSLMAYGG